MKSKLIITIIILIISLNLKAQNRMPYGQYTNAVSFNWADSVAKYDDLSAYYLLKGNSNMYNYTVRLWNACKVKNDSAQLKVKLAKDSVILEKKWKVKLQ
jgi:hypothetical protein